MDSYKSVINYGHAVVAKFTMHVFYITPNSICIRHENWKNKGKNCAPIINSGNFDLFVVYYKYHSSVTILWYDFISS